MTFKERKAVWMKRYLKRRKENGGRPLGGPHANRFKVIPMAQFDKMFLMKTNG